MLKHKKKKYYEIWGDTQSQNSLLKGLLVLAIIIKITLLITIISLASKKPLLISTNHKKQSIVVTEKFISKQFIKNEIKNRIKKFLILRHNWDFQNIQRQLAKASLFIIVENQKQFLKSNNLHITTARKKKISQKFYISSSIQVNLENNQALVNGDRILILNNLRATQPMSFIINYQFGNRSIQNPEGVYITKEKLVKIK